MTTLLGTALGALVTICVAMVGRDPYHRLRKALDVYQDLPEPYRSLWDEELSEAYVKVDVRTADEWLATIGLTIAVALTVVVNLAFGIK